MSPPAATVIVRCMNEERTIAATLAAVQRQTVVPEIIVVDSGSTDRSVELARGSSDRVIEIPAERFTYGYALNIGARAAAAPIHFSLSAHCAPERDDWIERSLEHYERADVAGTHGARELPGGHPLERPFYQDAEHARTNPYYGFSNHASSWRASVWEQFSFDERLDYAEDKEWAMRVLTAGWVIAVDPLLWVDMSHVWRSGLRTHYRRQKRAARALADVTAPPPYGLRDCLREWWSALPDERHAPLAYRLDYRRMVGLAGKYAGLRAARRSGAS
jgi:rhamnosyltransferase